MLDAHQLNVFIIAAETLNFTQAAQRLHMSQPSVSQHIQALERHFNTRLFSRSGRNLQLTDAGVALVPLARDLVNQSIRIDEVMSSLRGEVFGHLKVGCSTTPGKYILPQILAKFHEEYSKVKVSCQVHPQPDVVEMLCRGELNFALASYAHEICNDAEFIPFMIDTIVMIAPLDHPWAKNGIIQPKELRQGNFILREKNSGTYAAVQDTLDSLGVAMEELNTLLILGSAEATALAVEEGLGIGFVSSSVSTRLSMGKVAHVEIAGAEINRVLHFGRHTRLTATTAQKAFWEFINKLDLPLTNEFPIQEVLEKSL